jgi:predicted enzyme related to lactoylglutathione lyase
MPTLSEVRVQVDDTERAARFFGSIFGWELRHTRSGTSREAAVLVSNAAGVTPSAQLVFTDDPNEPKVRLGFTVSDLEDAAGRVDRLGGQVERHQLVVRSVDNQGTPLLLHAAAKETTATTPEGRGVLGVIFVLAQAPERAAEFYRTFAGWGFEAIGGNKDILFVTNGPVLGIRPASEAPDGQSGSVTFHISVPDPVAVTHGIRDRSGQVGRPQSAGIFTTRACSDDQGTAFSLWYQTAGT